MAPFDLIYQQLLADLLQQGTARHDRTQIGTLALFGRSFELDLGAGFPLLTLRRLSFRIVLLEQLWMLNGHSGADWLSERGVKIWQPWATEDGRLGPITGEQWRAWALPHGGRRDQLQALITGLRERPHSRRHLLTAWNVADLPDERLSPQANVREGRMALAPCLVTQQFFVEGDRLSMLVHQRSADVILGLPFDVAGSALLLHLIARHLNLRPHRLIVTLGDLHLYSNHLAQGRELLRRPPRAAPQLVFRGPPRPPYDYAEDELGLDGYEPHPALSAEVAV